MDLHIGSHILAKNLSSVHFAKTRFPQKRQYLPSNCQKHTYSKIFVLPKLLMLFIFQIGFYILLQNEPIKYGHRDFGCPLCSKRSNTKQHMEKHILTHTGEQPFACPYCTKRFNDYSNCRRHIRQCQQSTSSMNFFAE